jgi:hypothetical protein
MGSGNVGHPWGPNLCGGADWPTETTPAGQDIVQPDLYLYSYPMIGQIRDGVATGPVRSFRRRVDPAVGEHFPNNPMELFLDPALNNGCGSWTDNDSIAGIVPLTDRVLFVGGVAGSPIQDPTNPKAAHVFYANVENNWTCSHGHTAVPAGITGPTSTARFPFAAAYRWAELESVRLGEHRDYTLEPSAFVNLETTFGITTASIDSVGSAKMIAGGFHDRETGALYLISHDADPGGTTFGLVMPLIHQFRVEG